MEKNERKKKRFEKGKNLESGKANRENFVIVFQDLKFGWERFI